MIVVKGNIIYYPVDGRPLPEKMPGIKSMTFSFKTGLTIVCESIEAANKLMKMFQGE